MAVATVLSGWRRKLGIFPIFRQHDRMDCGPSCLRMIASYFGREFDLPFLRNKCSITKQGVSLLGISEAADAIGLRNIALKVKSDHLSRIPVPFIAWWKQNHYVVVYQVKNRHVHVADPGHGRVRYSRGEFEQAWLQNNAQGEPWGAAMVLEPTSLFYEQENIEEDQSPLVTILGRYLIRNRKLFLQVLAGLVMTSVIGLVLPLLTQLLVDRGIGYHDVGLIYVVLAAQLMLIAGQISIDMLRSWLLMHIGIRISISVVSDFLAKLLRVRLKIFDTMQVGDIVTRVNDHVRLENFLTSTSSNTAFGMLYSVALAIIVFVYDPLIAVVFVGGAALTVAWILFFVRKRAALDHQRFSEMADSQTAIITMYEGVKDLKLNGAEQQRRTQWHTIQGKIFSIAVRAMALEQSQVTGARVLMEGKNLAISLLAAQKVVSGEMTLGMMMALLYIVGQINGPLGELIPFLQTAQDANLGAQRLSSIQREPDEDDARLELRTPPRGRDINVHNLSFRYGGPSSPLVLDGVSFSIPWGTTCAIVGASGSGKTTLLNLLARFYDPTDGAILVGDRNLSTLSHRAWRDRCGAVLQGGYLFPDTIAANVALGDEHYDYARIVQACSIARIHDFVESLPLGYETKIGADGLTFSGGEQQRLLIARAIYRNPEFVFFDEATSALDAANERGVMEGIDWFAQNRSMVVVAHRLSTVRNANQIVVLDRGRVVEVGTHTELANRRGVYFNLVRNQLELGT